MGRIRSTQVRFTACSQGSSTGSILCFIDEATNAPTAALTGNIWIGPVWMPTERMTHHGYGAGPVAPVVARSNQLHHGLCYDGDGYFHAQGVPNQPIHLAGVLDIRRDLREIADLA